MAGKEDLLPNARNTPIGKQNNIANAEMIKVKDNPPHAAVSTYFKPKFPPEINFIPKNGYILYADNNPDWPGGDHQHLYYDFYKTDLGKPNGSMVEVKTGVAYKKFDKGLAAYNRTSSSESFSVDGTNITLGSLEGLLKTN